MTKDSPRRALISVSDKTGVIPFARELVSHGYSIMSTGGTAHALRQAQLPVEEVSEHTGFPEILDGRVKTLHPRVHAAILARAGKDDAALAEHDIPPVDLVAVNLYPFEKIVAEPGCDLQRAIETIDIGGPAMVRAAAKNHARVTVIVDPADYAPVLQEIACDGATSPETRFRLALRAFAHTARYDSMIANYLGGATTLGDEGEAFPDLYCLLLRKLKDLRYGENPHQRAALYAEYAPHEGSLAGARQVQGKGLSWNNLCDGATAWECVNDLDGGACVIVKHANPCGAALGADLRTAYDAAFECDPTSAYGGIIAFNRPLDAATARHVLERQFVEVIVAPAVEPDAVAVFERRPSLRVLECGNRGGDDDPPDLRSCGGGVVVQDTDRTRVGADDLEVVTRRKPDADQLSDLLFAWRVVRFVKSNAIVCARDGRTLGIGAGQTSRVWSVRLAALKSQEAGLSLNSAVLASDAFFPFADGIVAAAEAGVNAVIQPGGSRRDAEVIAAADEHDIAMVFTGTRHFYH